MDDLRALFDKQRQNRWRVATTSAHDRVAKIRRLRDAVVARRTELYDAMQADFKKAPTEVELTEIYPTLSEMQHTMKHLKKWMRPVRVKTPLTLAGTHSALRYEAKGNVLILAPWNYPFYLFVDPLVAAVAAGNCVMMRPSNKVPATARFLKSLVEGVFDPAEVAVVTGGTDVADALLALPFDHFFFTGSTRIGQQVMHAAAKHLASVTLELGGKSPTIVDASADLPRAAQRIVWGKFVNAGQTCVAPDHVFVHESVAARFLDEARKALATAYGATEEQRERSPDYCRIVDRPSLDRLKSLVDRSVAEGARIETGGAASPEDRYLSPTILSGVRPDSVLMQAEIFGPVLPVLTYRSTDEVFEQIRARGKPLALYVFSRDRAAVEQILANTTAGGTCVNNVLIHPANPNLPFGGVGASGMGSYHGHFGFRTFSHERAVLVQKRPAIVRFFYPPYKPGVKKMVAWVSKLYE